MAFKKQILFKWLKYSAILGGIIFFLLLVLAFSTLPFWAYYNLGTSQSKIETTPTAIILMGGGGFPGESNLIRAYYAKQAAKQFPHAAIILTLPGDTTDSNSSVMRFKNYLENPITDSIFIRLETTGRNTRGQCINIAEMINPNDPILVISSPEHLKRAVLCFRKVGFTKVSGLPAFENAIESGLLYDDAKLGGRKIPGTKIGNNLQVRYQFWNHLKLEIIVIREYCAISYYKLRGWI